MEFGIEGEGVVIDEEDEGAENQGVDEIIGDGGGVAGNLHAGAESHDEDRFEGGGVESEETENQKRAEDDFSEGKDVSEELHGEARQPTVGELILHAGDELRVAADEFSESPEKDHEAHADAQENVAEATRIDLHDVLRN